MPAAERANTLEFLGFRLDRLRRTLTSPDGRHVDLTPRVFDLLLALAERPGEVVTKSDLMDTVWPGTTVEENNLNQVVSTLRKALTDHGGDRGMIVTVSGRGYQLAASVAAVPEPAGSPGAAAVGAAEPGPEIAGRRRSPVAGMMSGLGGRIAAALAVAAAIIAAVMVYISVTGVGSAPPASVAVLPFADRNGDQSHLAAGMTDEVISRLRRIEGLTVAGGEWMPALVARLGDPKAIGASLSVTHLLEGGVRRDGDKLRISARLTATGDGHLVWSKEYELQTTEVFAIQDQIAHSVANALSVALGVGIQSESHGGTSDFEAYDHYLQGRALRNMLPPENAIGELEKAVAIDPMYARAWSELTIALGGRARLAKTMTEMAPTLARMDEASRNAERIAPDTWFGHTARAWYHLARNDWVAAEAAHKAADAAGDVSDPEFFVTRGAFSQQVGRLRARLRFDERLAQIDPHHPDVLGANFITLTSLGDYEAAWKAYRSGGNVRSGTNPNPEFHMVLLALADGKPDEARPWLRKNLKAKGPDGRTLADVLDEPDAALRLVRPTLDAPEGTQDRWTFVFGALMAGQFGDTGLAVELLRRAYLGPGWAGQYGIWFPQLRETRRTEGFKQFVRDLGFVRMWRASGDWGDFCHPLGEDDFECS